MNAVVSSLGLTSELLVKKLPVCYPLLTSLMLVGSTGAAQ